MFIRKQILKGNPHLLLQIKFTVEGREVVIPLGHDADDEKENSTCRTTQHVLVARDEGLISDEAYHELRMVLPDEERNILPPISVHMSQYMIGPPWIRIHSTWNRKWFTQWSIFHFVFLRYCCSDWKFLAMAYGLNAATGKYFCLWCHCTKAKICDFSSKCTSNILNYVLKDKFCRQYFV